ncbi:MAG: polyprenyl synthetase family protein [Planctomyces sp.]|nr:polyprenyl synthetase family protein [Planctomyces sp.]
MRYSTLAGGKRLRPLLVLLGCEACGGDVSEALPAAAAIEFVHTYSLIHDDLPAMDDDDLRRGVPTSHIKFGEATAILAGDGLLTLAFEVIAAGIAPAAAASCCRELAGAAGAEGMVGGQQADLEAETGGVSSVEHLESIHRRKTGRLICAALRMGGCVAGAGESQLRALTDYGLRIGLAFQIADDLLDLTSTAEKLGKGVQKDAARNKLTYPSLLGVEESRRRARRLVDEARAALEAFGPPARPLLALAEYVVARDV